MKKLILALYCFRFIFLASYSYAGIDDGYNPIDDSFVSTFLRMVSPGSSGKDIKIDITNLNEKEFKLLNNIFVFDQLLARAYNSSIGLVKNKDGTESFANPDEFRKAFQAEPRSIRLFSDLKNSP